MKVIPLGAGAYEIQGVQDDIIDTLEEMSRNYKKYLPMSDIRHFHYEDDPIINMAALHLPIHLGLKLISTEYGETSFVFKPDMDRGEVFDWHSDFQEGTDMDCKLILYFVDGEANEETGDRIGFLDEETGEEVWCNIKNRFLVMHESRSKQRFLHKREEYKQPLIRRVVLSMNCSGMDKFLAENL